MKCALIEYNYYHDITFPTFVHILRNLGINVDVYTTLENIDRNSLSYVNNKNEIKLKSVDSIRNKIYEKVACYRGYDFLLLNSIEPEKILDRVSEFNVPVLAVIHDPDIVFEYDEYKKYIDKSNSNIIVLAKHVSEYLKSCDINSDWMFPSYFGDVRFSNQSENTVFVVQGVVEFSRRNYQSLIESVAKIVDKGYDNFVVKIVGGIVAPNLVELKNIISENQLYNYFEIIEGDLPYSEYYKVIKSSDFLLPLIDKTNKKYESYFSTKISTSIPVAIGLNIIPIIHNELSLLYDLNGSCLEYSDGDLYSGMVKALQLEKREISIIKQKLSSVNQYYIEKSKINLNNAINNLLN